MSIIEEGSKEGSKEDNDNVSIVIIQNKDDYKQVDHNDLKNSKLHKYFLLNFNTLINGN